MTKRLLLFTFLLCVLSLTGCDDSNFNKEASEGYREPYFSIFLVKSSSPSRIDDEDITKLQIESTPYLTDRDLVSYNWENHTMVLKKEKLASQTAILGRRFVVLAENQRIYTGQFLTPAISSTRDTPVIIESGKEIKIQNGYPNDSYGKSEDPRGDMRIYEGLKKANILLE